MIAAPPPNLVAVKFKKEGFVSVCLIKISHPSVYLLFDFVPHFCSRLHSGGGGENWALTNLVTTNWWGEWENT